MGNIVSFITVFGAWASEAVRGVQEARELVEWATGRINTMLEEQRDPTDEEWEEINARTMALRDKLHSDDR